MGRDDRTLPQLRENVSSMSLIETLPDCYKGDPGLLLPGQAMRPSPVRIAVTGDRYRIDTVPGTSSAGERTTVLHATCTLDSGCLR